jgi:hypothetical protein
MWQLILAGSLAGVAPVPPADAGKPPLVTPKRLIEMYLQNEAFADERYSGKVIHVRVKVARISRDGDEYHLHPDTEGAGQGKDEPTTLMIVFPMKERKALAALNVGDTVTVSGRCSQRQARAYLDEMKRVRRTSQITLAECSIVGKAPLK